MNMINIAVIGYGVIGSGVVEIIDKNRNLISGQINDVINVKYILDIRDFSNHPLKDKFIKDFSIIENDPDVKIVAEMIGGQHPAYEFSMAALKAGKSVVTSNKEVVAYHGDELLKTASDNGVSYLFEASVGGGIPIIRPMRSSLAGNQVVSATGILNGTTNYVLTHMKHDGKTMEEALCEAKANGYAEANPSSDLNGSDTCRKICILAAMAFGKIISPDDVTREGIENITLRDINDADTLNRSVKLLGRTEKLIDGRILIMVAPFLVSKSNPLAGIDDVFNGITVVGESVGELMFYGKGAGKMPTASAVLSDIIEIAVGIEGRKVLKQSSNERWEKCTKSEICPAEDVPFEYYIRIKSDPNDKKFAMTAAASAWIKLSSENGEASYLTKKILPSELENKLEGSAVLSKIRLL